MKIAYLVNQYPKVSHSFIRREILALEEQGVEIMRYSMRKVPVRELVDEQDIAEHAKTESLLAVGLFRLLLAAGEALISRPLLFARAFVLATSFGSRNRRGVIRHWIYLIEACYLKRQLSSNHIHHVHAHFGTNSTTVALLCNALGGPGFSFTVHGPEEFDDSYGLSLSEKISRCRFVAAVSSYGKSQLMRQIRPEEWGKIQVVRCSVDHFFLDMSVSRKIPEERRLICVGRLCEQKGQLLLVDAIGKLCRAGEKFEVVLAGDGEMREVIEERLESFGLEKYVRITGWLSAEQVREQILKSRALVLPSFAEGLPVVIMEALALGRPVISTYIAGIPELVENGLNGWLIPAGSEDGLVSAISSCLHCDDAGLALMGQKGRRRVAENHSGGMVAEQLAGYFRRYAEKAVLQN